MAAKCRKLLPVLFLRAHLPVIMMMTWTTIVLLLFCGPVTVVADNGNNGSPVFFFSAKRWLTSRPSTTKTEKTALIKTPPPKHHSSSAGAADDHYDDLTKEILDRFQNELKQVPLVSRRKVKMSSSSSSQSESSGGDSSSSATTSTTRTMIDIRLKWQDEKNLITYCEVPFVPIMPSAFQEYFHNLSNEMPTADVLVKSVVELEQQQQRVGLKGILHAPFPCSNRLLILWKYIVSRPSAVTASKNNNNDHDNGKEHLLILTDRDNDQLIKKYQTKKEVKSLVLAKATIAYWIRPVTREVVVHENNNQKQEIVVVGSHLHYLFHGDIGGSIPKWIKNTVGPRNAYDTVNGLLKHLENKNKQ